MNNKKENGYAVIADIEQLADTLIANLEMGSTSKWKYNLYSQYFVLAKSETEPAQDAMVSLTKVVTGLKPDEFYYSVSLVDGLNPRHDVDRVEFRTSNLKRESLVTTLYEIAGGLPKAASKEGKIGEEAEFAYLKSYIQGACLDDEVSVDYLYALWIAFCLHHGLTVEKDEYQERLEELWKALEESDEGEVSHWENYSDFDSSMSRKLC